MELTAEQQQRRESRDELVQALGVQVRGKVLRCPYHNDQHPSASIHHDADGAWRFHCFVCDLKLDVFDVLARNQNRILGDVLKEARGEQVTAEPEPEPTVYGDLATATSIFPNVERVYQYRHPDTRETELAIVRYQSYGKKKFAQVSPVKDGWVLKAPKGKLPLYNRTRVRESKSVIVVEGEKAVHALADIGIVATTSPGGAGKANKADWSPLEGKNVYLWPDNDPADERTGKKTGEDHMKDVQAILETMDCALFWIEPENLSLPPKGDAVEFIQANGGSIADQKIAVSLVMDEAASLGAVKELEAHINAIISGQWSDLEWPWREMTAEAQALLPDTVTALCGDPGAAKSLLMLEAFWHWHVNGIKTALFMLEDDKTYHLKRTLAQLERNSYLTQAEWMHNNPEKARAALSHWKDILDSFSRTLYDAPDKIISLSDLAEWFEARCKEGVEICGIDPVTAAQASDKPWIDDQKFIFDVKRIAKQYHARLIYVIHPRVANGKAGPSLSRLAGGAAYSRFSHSVFWLTRNDHEQTSTVYSSDAGNRLVTFERSVKISKARNGRGAGAEIAFHLNPETLCFEEYGVIVDDANAKVRV